MESTENQIPVNYLPGPYNTPHGVAPFGLFVTSDFLPAIRSSIDLARLAVKAIIDEPSPPDFSNTIEALECSNRQLERISTLFFNLLHAESDDEMQTMAQEISPRLTTFENDVYLSQELFSRVEAVFRQKGELPLTDEQRMLLDETRLKFIRNGATLNEVQKARFRELSAQLSLLSLKFGENVLKETSRYEKLVTNSNELEGLPGSLVETLKEKALQKNLDGWLLDITAPVYMQAIKYAENRELRKELFMAFNSKGFKGDSYDNSHNIIEMVNLRREMAQMLGYRTYAEYSLEQSMATTVEKVYGLLDQLLMAALPVYEREKAEVEAFSRSLGFTGDLMPWDWLYFAEKLKMEKFCLNDEMLKPYFELQSTIEGVFGLATELFGITFRPAPDIPVYHPEVKVYEVFDKDGRFLAVLYADFHPRPGKQSGAWMDELKPQYREKGQDSRPHITIVMNFTRPTPTLPSLLTFNELQTLLHEFGHALHGILSECNYAKLSGTRVYRDFVELPSQIMENWAVEKEFLDRFAVHYLTGEKIPASLIGQIKESENFLTGYQTIRQLGFGYLDLAWHTLSQPFNGDIKAFEEEVLNKARLFKRVDGVAQSTQFLHLFAGEYAAGYYSYKWSETLDADAFELFREKGVFDSETATSFRRNIFERGGTEHPMLLYKRFRGKEPSVEALLVRSGLKH